MALYDKDYVAGQQSVADRLGSKTALSAFIKKTYQLFAASLLAGSVGAYLGLDFVVQLGQLGLLMLFPLLVAFVALIFFKRVSGLNYLLLFVFAFICGLTLSPMLFWYISAGAGQIVVLAFVLTTIAFGSLSVFAMNTSKDFTFMGKMLFIALIVVVAGILLNYFVFKSSLFSLAISCVCVMLFSAFILYDTQNIIRGNYETPIDGAINLYLDFLNLFVHLLNILGFLNRE